jgi:hypothetical protein
VFTDTFQKFIRTSLLQVIVACMSKHSDLIQKCIEILGRWLQMVRTLSLFILQTRSPLHLCFHLFLYKHTLILS